MSGSAREPERRIRFKVYRDAREGCAAGRRGARGMRHRGRTRIARRGSDRGGASFVVVAILEALDRI